MLEHAKQNPYACPVCPIAFADKESLVDHQEEAHKACKTQKCPTCGKSFINLRNMKKHKLLHKVVHPRRRCFGSRYFLRSSVPPSLLATNSSNLPLPDTPAEVISLHRCKECSVTFSSLDFLAIHQLCHSTRDVNTEEDREILVGSLSLERQRLPQSPSSPTPLLSSSPRDTGDQPASLYAYQHPDDLYVYPTPSTSFPPPVLPYITNVFSYRNTSQTNTSAVTTPEPFGWCDYNRFPVDNSQVLSEHLYAAPPPVSSSAAGPPGRPPQPHPDKLSGRSSRVHTSPKAQVHKIQFICRVAQLHWDGCAGRGSLTMSEDLDTKEVKQVVVGEEGQAAMGLASDSKENIYKAFIKEEPADPLLMSASNEFDEEEPTAPLVIKSCHQDSLQCFQCFITFSNLKTKERHMKKSHRAEYKQQLQEDDTLFTCYVCDRTFLSSMELTMHQAIHKTEEKPFKCTHCPESFRTFTEVVSHRRHMCRGRHYVCQTCGNSFRGIRLKRAHQDSCHPGDTCDEGKTHHCALCGQGFDSEAELLQHQESHSGDRCCRGKAPTKRRGRPALQLEPAKEKMKRQRGRPPKHAPGIELPQGQGQAEAEGQANINPTPEPCRHACSQSEASFLGTEQLRAHKKDEHGQLPPPQRPQACQECEESFSRPEQLESHTAHAHGDGRHSCTTCGKSFGQENSLKAHQQTHATTAEPTDGDCK
ncbi:hypothetical protein GJAV_G00101830 [Gymnothorax javanicus]|nr:hypothetical protein GJAV_G00101830 [Gymnothorax javanicus]